MLRDGASMNSDCSAEDVRRRKRRREVRAQLDEEPGDEDGEDEQRRGGAEYRCLGRRRCVLATAVLETRWGRRRAWVVTIGRREVAECR